MSLSVLMRRMLDLGAPMEAVLLAVEEIEAMQATIDARRVADRDRKRTERAERESRKSANVHGQSEENLGTVLDVSEQTPFPLNPPLKSFPNPSKTTPPISPKPNYLRGTDLEDWLPAEQWLAFVRTRKAIPKVAFTEDTARLVVRKLDRFRLEGYDPGLLLERAVESGWRTVFKHDDCKSTGGGDWSPERKAALLAKIDPPPDPAMAGAVTSLVRQVGGR